MQLDRWIFIGVDLGQRRDYSAIAVVERVFERSTVEEFLRRDGMGSGGFA